MPGALPVRVDAAAVAQFAQSAPVATFLLRDAERVTQAAKRFAPVSPSGSHGRRSGYGRSQIRYEPGRDAAGLFVDVLSPATSPQGAPYMLFQEVGTSRMAGQPHLRPALDTVFPGATGVAPTKHPRKTRRPAGRRRRRR